MILPSPPCRRLVAAHHLGLCVGLAAMLSPSRPVAASSRPHILGPYRVHRAGSPFQKENRLYPL
eukprot:3395763-Pyramimonas_sp.AAC.1